MIEVLGYTAAGLKAAAFLPQALSVIRTRQTENLSLMMYTVFVLGVAMWWVYGWVSAIWPIVIGSTITLTCASVILTIMVRDRREGRKT